MLIEFGSDCGIVQCAKTMGDQTMLHGVAYSHWCEKLESGRCFACRCGIEFGPFNVAGFPGRLRNNPFRLVLFVCSIAIFAKNCYVYTVYQ